MKLTSRQQAFLRQLIQLSEGGRRPVHYTEVAERLAVNKFSAYDMLRVLQEKGLVKAEYILDEIRGGPGRSMVMFLPTASAMQWWNQIATEGRLGQEWQELKKRLLSKARSTQETGYLEWLSELLAHLSEARSPVEYCAQFITALLLNLTQARSRVVGLNPFEALRNLTSTGVAGLGALAGLSLGTGLTDSLDYHLLAGLYDHAQRYQRYLQTLSEESRRALSEFLQEAITVFAGSR